MQAVAFVIGTVAQNVLGPGAGGCIVQADSANTADVFLGGQSVTADATPTGGYRLAAGVSLPVTITGDDRLFAIVAAGTQVLRLIYQGDNAELGAV